MHVHIILSGLFEQYYRPKSRVWFRRFSVKGPRPGSEVIRLFEVYTKTTDVFKRLVTKFKLF